MPAMPDQEQVDDFRAWLTGKMPKNGKDVDPKLLQDLMKKVGEMPKGQQTDPSAIEKLLKDNPKFKDPEFLKQLQKLVESKNFAGDLQQQLNPGLEGAQPTVEQNPQDLADKFKKLLDGAKEGNPDGPGGEHGPPDVPKLPDPKVENPLKEQYGDNEWVKWAEKHFGDSPAAQAAMKDLFSSLEGPLGKGSFDQFPEFSGDLFKDLGGLKGPDGDGFKLKPPDMGEPSWIGPKVTGTGGGMPSIGGGGPSIGGGGPAGVGSGGGTALAIIAALAGALFLAVLLLRKWQLNREAVRNGSSITHGPLDFSSVRTREQLVAAFETVSLDQCGDDARAWNHRVITSQIGDARPAVAQPAADLGRMYEVARYAPPDEDLMPGDYVEARKDLGVIAGVSA